MDTPPSQLVPCLLFGVASVLGAVGQYLYKQGSQTLSTSAPLNASLLLGMIAFVGVMALFVIAYRLGGRMGIVYPFYACTFVWGALLGVWLDGEAWSGLQILGIGVIVFGVALVGAGA